MVQSAISVEDEILDMMAKEVAKEIDDGIMANIYMEIGWIKVEHNFKDIDQPYQIRQWLELMNITEYQLFGNVYLFEKAQDAEWFILKWQ